MSEKKKKPNEVGIAYNLELCFPWGVANRVCECYLMGKLRDN